MSHLNIIFAVWDDNAEAMAADIDEKGVTVRQWRNRGDIPSRAAQLKIIRAAFDKNGTVLKLEDFLSPEEREGLPLHGGPDSAAAMGSSARNYPDRIGGDGLALAAADNCDGNIGGSGSPDNRAQHIGGEADSRGPFSDSPPTSSSIPGPSGSFTNAACSTGEAEAA
jgi:hypothetical protein